jgi:hypothetical protein
MVPGLAVFSGISVGFERENSKEAGRMNEGPKSIGNNK